MNVILTGAAGFIGSAYLTQLNEWGADRVYLVDATDEGAHSPNLAGKRCADYWNRDELLARVESNRMPDTDLIVHLGACADTTERDRAFLDRNNVRYSQALCRWAMANGARFHYASSASVYGDGKRGYDDNPAKLTGYQPLNPYAESKWLFDRWLDESHLLDSVVGFRYFNVFGPNEYHKGDMRSMVCKAFDQIQAGGRARLFATSRPGYGDGSEERDFVYIKDVVAAMAFFLDHPDRHGVFNVGTGQARTFKDLVTAVYRALGREPDIEFIPMPDSLKGQYQYFTEADLRRLRATGFERPFTRLEDAVADYVQRHLAPGRKIF